MNYAYSLGGGPELIKTLKIGATVGYKGIFVQSDSNNYGEVKLGTTTGADVIGLAISTGTYATATEATVEAVIAPLGVFRARMSGSATEGTALSAATKHVLTQTSASTTVMTAADAPTTVVTAGSLYMLSGANAGLRRVISGVSSGASVTVTVAFPNSIAVGDKGLAIPYRIGTSKVQATTYMYEADASITVGTGMDGSVVDLEVEKPINTTNPVAWVFFCLHDQLWNPVD